MLWFKLNKEYATNSELASCEISPFFFPSSMTCLNTFSSSLKSFRSISYIEGSICPISSEELVIIQLLGMSSE